MVLPPTIRVWALTLTILVVPTSIRSLTESESTVFINNDFRLMPVT